MKDSEERERGAGLAPPEPELPPDEPDPLGADAGPPDEKDPLGAEAAPGALGQVKAKVEVCKDESVGKLRVNLAPKEEGPVCACPPLRPGDPPAGRRHCPDGLCSRLWGLLAPGVCLLVLGPPAGVGAATASAPRAPLVLGNLSLARPHLFCGGGSLSPCPVPVRGWCVFHP